MLFNSLEFLVFFGVLFFTYYAVPSKYRRYLLLLASCYFYAAYVPAFIFILFFLILTDFILGLQIAKTEGKRRTHLLICSIVANVGILFVFKYFNFFNENVAALAELIHWNYPLVFLEIALPLGLSFHVFQSLAYVIEVYRRKVLPEKSLSAYALYVMFFPQLVAGPIERPQHLLPQVHLEHAFNATRIRRGLELILIGFFKKLVIADQLALLVNHVYANISDATGLMLLIAVVAFTYQLYCDFSGYSDIAIGSALVFGYTLSVNFQRPFAARSIAEFWRRWHISLSSWLRDYLYLPLAFSWGKNSKIRLYASLFITFVLIGLWHGANWTFVIMGALHGGYLVSSIVTADLRKRAYSVFKHPWQLALHNMWQVSVTFVLVTISFIFFRSQSVAEAVAVVSGILYASWNGNLLNVDWRQMMTPGGIGIGLKTGLILLASIVFLEILQYVQDKNKTSHIFDERSQTVRYIWYLTLIFLILFFGYFGAQKFIYFQF